VHLDPHLMTFFILILSGFVAAFIDSMVGGGGLITVPALLLSGLPAPMVLGTNKLAGTMGSSTSTISYLVSGKVNFSVVKYWFPLSFIGSILGAYIVHQLPSSFLRPMVVVLLIVITIYTIFKRDSGKESTYRGLTKRMMWLAALIAVIIGFYDGFFGPGTGSFLIVAFLMVGFDFVTAAGSARALNFASNLGALLMFASLHAVNYTYGLTMGVAMVLGAIAGSRFAIRRGPSVVKPLFLTVTILLIGKQVWTLFIH